jgi:two-component system sensor histidine kinase PilS (NtrC family)
MLLRTIVISLVLGLALWTAPGSRLLLGVVVTTYALTIVYAMMLRRGAAPERLVWPQLIGDLAVTAVLVHATGGARSGYTFFFALSIVGAAIVRSRRTTVLVTLAAAGLMTLVALSAWKGVVPIPAVPPIEPQAQGLSDFLRSLGLNVGALVGVGGLAFLLAGELQRSEAEVADLVTVHEDIVRSLPSGLVTVDLDGRVLTVNEKAAAMLGGGRLGQDIGELLPGLDVADNQRRIDLVIGKAVLGISVAPLRDVRQRVVGRIINFTDLTELRRIEAQMKRAERMATIGQLAAGIAHEIRNPLASMSGSIELLREAPDLSEDDKTLMNIVVREIDRLNQLITDLLDYANPRPREPAELDLSVLVEETVTVFRQDKNRGEVEVTSILPPPGTLVVHADPAKMRQVVWNLLRNASDAASGGGGNVALAVTDAGPNVELSITDDGPGIPKESLPHIFDPFFTTKKKGTGLGLATCVNIVTEHGGTIDVESEPGSGTRLVVRLPRGK